MNNQFKQLLNTILVNINNGNFDKSKLLLTYALDINPKNYEVLSLMGYVCAIQKNLEEAEDYLNRALAINPNDAVAIFNLANLLSEHNKFEESIKLLERAENLYPTKSNLYHLHAKCLAGTGRVSESFSFYQKSLNLSLSLEILFEFCNLLVKNGFIEEAISQYDYASVAHPNRSELYINKGILLHKLRRFNQAINEYDKAIKINPNLADAWSNKGVTLSELRLSEEAKLHFEEAINLRSDYAEAWANLGASLIDLHHYDEALVSLDNAVSLRKNFPEVYGSKALAYRLSKNYYKSAEFYLLAYDQATHDNFYLGQALHQLMLCCDWAKFDEISKKIEDGIKLGERVAEPFGYQAVSFSEANLFKCANIFCSALFPPNLINLKKFKHEKIRVGYLCGEFRQQATSILLSRVWELHDQSKFEIYAFDTVGGDGSNYRKRIENSFSKILDISKKSTQDISNLITAHEIDILVNLNGYFGHIRQDVFAMRPAPIQVNFLGFPGTLGCEYIDYLIADKIVIPEISKQWYSEKIIYLPNSYQANDDDRKISSKIYSRIDQGLPDNSFIFCCFNNTYKITPGIFDIWMRILNSVQNSVLWLLESNEHSTINLKKEAIKRGVNENRIIFAKRLSIDEHLSRHRLADLFLDTIPYNAHTTASDALWSGVPVLTCLGSTFPGRVSSSLLHAIGLPELIAPSLTEYETMAIDLAKNPHKLSTIRLKLQENSKIFPLFNSNLYTQNLEAAYKKMYEIYSSDMPPESFCV